MSAIVFDLDGTLIDSAPDIHAAVARMLADHGLSPLDADLVRGFIGNGAPALVTRVIAAAGLTPDPARDAAMLAGFLRHYEAAVDLTALYPDVPETLEDLRSAGHVLGLCTNKPEGPTRTVLEHFGLAAMFGAILGGDSLPVRKPDPAPLNHVFAALGQDGLFVGDSEVDAETAVRARRPFVLFTEGYRKTPVEEMPHTASFRYFRDLPALVWRIGRKP